MIPSVTQILQPFSGLSQVPAYRLAAAAERGKRVHALCAAYAQGLYLPPLEPDIQGYVESFQRWFDLAVDQVIAVEEELIDEALPLKGHPDFILRFRGDYYPAILDNKTPIAKSLTWRLQLAAYKRLALPKYEIDRVASLRLSPDGKMPKLDEYTRYTEDWPVFEGMRRAYMFFKMAA